MKLAIDANAYQAFVDGDEVCVKIFRTAKSIAVPVVVLGELRAGFAYGNQPLDNEAVLARILASNRLSILDVCDTTPHWYAKVWSTLRKKGRLIPADDIWIAAQCLEVDLTLVTRDRHFANVDGLRVLDWSQP